MLFFASDRLSRIPVWPVLDPGVLAGSDGEGAAVGLVVGLPVDAARGGCTPGISPPVVWHPASTRTRMVNPRTIWAPERTTSRCHDHKWRSGEAWLCAECAGPCGESGTGES